jgi:hypothetical protein
VVAQASVTEPSPVPWAADLVVTFGEAGRGAPQLVVAVTVEHEPDPEKRFVWPQYVLALAARHRAPVVLVVWAFDAATAAWARGPHEIAPGFTFTPVVVEPDSLPSFQSDEEIASRLDFAVLVALSLLGGASSPRGKPLSQASAELVLRVVKAVMALDDEVRRRHFLSLLLGTAPEPFRTTLKQVVGAE